MTIRTRLILYIIAINIIAGSLGAYLLWDYYRLLLIPLEILFVILIYLGIYLVRSVEFPVKMITTGIDLIRDKDFTHGFVETGSVDLKRLVKLYNEMIANLREERIKAKEQHVFLNKVLEASPAGIITLDLELKITHLNSSAAKFLDIAPDSVTDKQLSEIDSPIASTLLQLDEDESRVVTINGHHRVKCIHSKYYSTGFQRSFYLIIDVTKEIWKSEKTAYETLIRTLAHEVNNTIGSTNSILRSCLAYSNQLNDNDREDFVNALEVAIERTDHLNMFMHSYADIIRLPDPVKSVESLYSLLENTIRLIEPECNEKNITISKHFQNGDFNIDIDIPQIEQVLVNVTRNAIESIKFDGTIVFKVHKIDNKPMLEILDSGAGIPEEVKEQIFTPFFSTKNEGQGIGLTLVNEILSRHNFDFSLTNVEENLTSFKIYLN